jgi:HD superfamily phosphohydrolase
MISDTILVAYWVYIIFGLISYIFIFVVFFNYRKYSNYNYRRLEEKVEKECDEIKRYIMFLGIADKETKKEQVVELLTIQEDQKIKRSEEHKQAISDKKKEWWKRKRAQDLNPAPDPEKSIPL